MTGHFNAPSPQHSLSTCALRRNLVDRKRNKRPSSAYTILPIGDRAPSQQGRSSRQKTGVLRYRRNHGGTHGENQNFEHGSGVDISGEAQRFRQLPVDRLDCDRAKRRRRMGSRDGCEGARGLPSLRKAHRANSEAAPRDLRSGGGLNISRQKTRGAPPNGLWELQN